MESATIDISLVNIPSRGSSTNNQAEEPNLSTAIGSDRASQAHYQHDPLESDKIRLFRVLPRERDGVLRCQLEHHPFTGGEHPSEQQSSTPKYLCLSYAWGPRTPTHEIEIDAQKFRIRANIWHFLKRLELPIWPSRYLWADIICINQLDNAEKSAQVAIMNEIFHRADGVLAWVGEEADDSALLMNLAKFMRVQEGKAGLTLLSVSAERLRVWRALKAFLKRPYWERTWIVQEIILAAGPVQIYCGVDITEYWAIYALLEFFRMRFNFRDLRALKCRCKKRQELCEHQLLIQCAKEACQLQLPTLRSYYQTNGPPSERLLDLLDRYSHTKCEDPRDKIFAFLHLQTDIPNGLVPYIINYGRDVHSYFFEILSMYTRTNESLERKDEEQLSLYNIESLVECGRLLMRTLHISPPSLRRWLDDTTAAHERLYWNCYFRPKVIMEAACGFSGGACIIFVGSVYKQDQGHCYEFVVQNDYLAEPPHVRGVAVDAQIGDWVFRAEASDVAVVIRAVGQYTAPISWAIVGEGAHWLPNERTLQRLGMLQREPVPSSEDFIGIDELLPMYKVLETMRDHITESGISEEEPPLPNDAYTADKPARTRRTRRRYIVSLDLPVVVIVIEGHFQFDRANERNRYEGLRGILASKRRRTVPWRRPRVVMKRPWRRRRSRARRRVRIHVKGSEKSRRRAMQRLWKYWICPGINRCYREQRLEEVFVWQKFLETPVAAADSHPSQPPELAETDQSRIVDGTSSSS